MPKLYCVALVQAILPISLFVVGLSSVTLVHLAAFSGLVLEGIWQCAH